jgi:hypothetical protein
VHEVDRMIRKTLILLGVAAALLVPSVSSVQSLAEPKAGSTSGPAAGSPTTAGSGGTVGATPHQLDTVKDPGASVTRETEQNPVGSGASQAPRGPAVGVQGGEGAQSGPKAGDAAETAKQ